MSNTTNYITNTNKDLSKLYPLYEVFSYSGTFSANTNYSSSFTFTKNLTSSTLLTIIPSFEWTSGINAETWINAANSTNNTLIYNTSATGFAWGFYNLTTTWTGKIVFLVIFNSSTN